MFKLVSLGILSGAFFSTTFILNEVMSLDGGHWVWSASLRYFFMALFLILIILFKSGRQHLCDIFALFRAHWQFWSISGSVGFGGFYALICFSADFSPGWVIAATWQFTVVASLFIFMLFGHSFPKRIWFFSFLIFTGVVLVNLSYIETFDLNALLSGGIPVLVAGFCYPFGNQLVWEAANGNSKLPAIQSPLLHNVLHKILLMTLGSFPLWIVLLFATRPPLPALSQIVNTSLVAFFSGICATGIFLFARNLASHPKELAGVDATQSSEALFALLGGILFLKSEPPGIAALGGLLLIVTGLIFFAASEKQ